MTRWVHAALAIVIAMPSAHADEVPPRIRELYEQGDYEAVRRELLVAYETAPTPALLFALGQVELNLGNYDAAITYYEKFIATGPGDEQVALAQQAIGAARMRLAQPRPEPPPPPPPARVVVPRRWQLEDTGLVALGGTAVVVGAGLVLYARSLAHDRSGTLAEYDERVGQARTSRWTGAAIAGAGVLVVGGAILRWRLRGGETVVSARVEPGGAALQLGARW